MFVSATNANLKNYLRKRYLILQVASKHCCISDSTSSLDYVKIKNQELSAASPERNSISNFIHLVAYN